MRMVLFAAALTVIVGAQPFIAASTAAGAGTASQKCSAAKLKAAGKKSQAKLVCHAKAAARGATVDPACLAKAETKYAVAWDKIEASGGCTTSGDKVTIEGIVDTFVGTIATALGVQAPVTCSPPCGVNASCEAATTTCQCNVGFLLQGGSCQPAPLGHPSTRTQADVCGRWTAGHVVTEPDPLVATGADCDAGTLKPAAIADTLARINMFRWLVGLEPTTSDAISNASAQLCANLEAWWDFGLGGSPHTPPSSSKCYTSAGAAIAGESNIVWGPGNPADAIDVFVRDPGNDSTLGQRRWMLNPPLGPVGIGYWQTGGQYGNAECVRVFGGSGPSQTQPWTSVPNAGFAPIETTQWAWSFHSSVAGTTSATVAMRRVDDDTPLPVILEPLLSGSGQDAVGWVPDGWQTESGKTYRVTVSGLAGGDVVYDVRPVTCN